MESPIFEDRWSRLTQSKLTIKTYFFPTAQNKKIDVKKIVAVYFQSQREAELMSVKGWGMSLSPCWWACDLNRGWRDLNKTEHFNIVVDCGESTYKGFTTTDLYGFLQCARAILSPEVTYTNGMPF